MKKKIIAGVIAGFSFAGAVVMADGIYLDGWIDRNKNGEMDPYENPALPVDARVQAAI